MTMTNDDVALDHMEFLPALPLCSNIVHTRIVPALIIRT